MLAKCDQVYLTCFCCPQPCSNVERSTTEVVHGPVTRLQVRNIIVAISNMLCFRIRVVFRNVVSLDGLVLRSNFFMRLHNKFGWCHFGCVWNDYVYNDMLSKLIVQIKIGMFHFDFNPILLYIRCSQPVVQRLQFNTYMCSTCWLVVKFGARVPLLLFAMLQSNGIVQLSNCCFID